MTHSPSFQTSLEQGVSIIAMHVKTLSPSPGVYRMINQQAEVLYVGKAKNLKKRVHSYTQAYRLPNRLQRMVAETHTMEFITTHTEVEALLLEANLIKRLKPRYNILLKDNKFFSYILLSNHEWPSLTKHRGAKTLPGTYFGPFASTYAVNQTLTTMYRIFKLRSCSDSFFASRKRPCLQYHIKRCTAPCTRYIKASDYEESVQQTKSFLEGKSHELQQNLSQRMHESSECQDYEKATHYRDQIRALTQIQAQQNINTALKEDTDVIAIASHGETTCIQIFFFRHGSNFGSHSFFPEHTKDLSIEEVLASFLTLFYQDTLPPQEILLSHPLKEQGLVEEALSLTAERKVNISIPQRGQRVKILRQALENADEALARHLSSNRSQLKILNEVADVFGLTNMPQRIEVYDNSHIQGTNAIGAMIVAGSQGFDKASYRKFTIKIDEEGAPTPGDDYGMMREVIRRRFSGSLAQDQSRNPFPHLLLIDGGIGHLNAVYEILENFGLSIPVVAIAKGPERNAGKETFFQPGRAPFSLEKHKTVLFYLQQLRDEAHRFAITFHRQKRTKTIERSMLDDILGIGSHRKKSLLRHFGSTREVARAGIEDLQSVKGISASLAQKIYDYFH
ncbi:MAG: excinuclease ABC subunit UvrC [Candidatus Paracaedimonas acanthamoebae]|uniref:UvrABC system protein C n=1 Tax=Candidatus Paracaedimonas acanthamoebae TaxID=244581 RepID=A0A8J7PIM8_9PROT|nr:excinuclease ABC subunit UvrC [Candidatus Paracaedimonas acanthamoebae]